MTSDLASALLCIASALVGGLATSVYWILKVQHQQCQHEGQQQHDSKQQHHQHIQTIWLCKKAQVWHTSDQCQALKGHQPSAVEVCKFCARNRQITGYQKTPDKDQ